MCTNILDKTIDMSTVIVASHEFEYIFTRVLKWYVEVWEELRELLKSLEMRECEDIWIEIVYTILEIPWNCIDCFEHLDQARFAVEISSITSGILRDDLYLTDSL